MSYNPELPVDPKSGSTPSSEQETKRPRSERLFVNVERYETPNDGPSYAVGTTLNGGEAVRVRLSTINEHHGDRPKKSLESIKSLYSTGETTRPKLTDKAKGDAPVKLLSFDDARLVQSSDGTKEYRAHWANTMNTNNDGEYFVGQAHVRLREVGERQQSFIEVVKGTSLIDPANPEESIRQAMQIKDEHGNSRAPFVMARVFDEQGDLKSGQRIYPLREEIQYYDDATGENKTGSKNASADALMSHLTAAEPGENAKTTAAQDTFRAIIAGYKGEDPVLATKDDRSVAALKNMAAGIAAGALRVELVEMETLKFGKDSHKTYFSNRNNFTLRGYSESKENKKGQMYEQSNFCESVIAFNRFPDGEPQVVFVAPTAPFPKHQPLHRLQFDSTPQPEVSQERSMEQETPQSSMDQGTPQPPTNEQEDDHDIDMSP